jgi:hypothetical protein
MTGRWHACTLSPIRFGVRKAWVVIMRIWIVLAMTAASMLSMGCAAIFKGSTQSVQFLSTPNDADVRVDNRYAGPTPVASEVDRYHSQSIVISKEGYREQYVRLHRRPDTAWWFWDIATCVVPITLCIPILVDAISGAWMDVDDVVRVKLDPLPMTSTTTARPPAPERPTPPAPAPAAAATIESVNPYE